MFRKSKKYVGLVVSALMILLLFGCPMYTAVGFKYAETSDGGEDGQEIGTDPVEIETTADSITLAWDAPSPDIEFYEVRFRVHGANPPDSVPWYSIQDNIPADPSPELIVNRVGTGFFDFGVLAKILDEDSALHSSLDVTAQPDTGWYLIWNE